MFNTSSPVWDGSLEKLSKAEIQNLEKVHRALKRIFSLPITTPYIGLIIDTGVWPAEQRINYRQQQGQIGQTKNKRTKSRKTSSMTKEGQQLKKYKIRKSSNNEIRLEKNSQR